MDLAHPNIVRIYDFTGNEELCGFVMEFIKGQTLDEMRRKKQPSFYEINDVSSWAAQMFSALNYAWNQAGLIHGDLRPGNLFVTTDGTLKIAEFGLAPVRQSAPATDDQLLSGSLSLSCLSPQRIRGSKPQHQDDIYAGGACLYELLTGKPVFPGGNVPVQIQQFIPPTVAQRRAELSAKGSAISKAWEMLLADCLAKEPQNRPSTAAEVLKRIEAAPMATSGGTSGSLKHLTTAFQAGSAIRWLRHPAAIAAMLIGCAFVAVYFLVLRPRDAELAERRMKIAQLEKADVLAESSPKEREAAWKECVNEFSLKPVRFADEDDFMLQLARDRMHSWQTKAIVESTKEEERHRKEKNQTDLLSKLVMIQSGADKESKYSAEERSKAWSALLAQFDKPDRPDTPEFDTLLAEVNSHRNSWDQKIADARTKTEEQARMAAANAKAWLDGKTSEVAALVALGNQPETSAFTQVEKADLLLASLTGGPAGSEEGGDLLKAKVGTFRELAVKKANEETPNAPLKLPELLADQPALSDVEKAKWDVMSKGLVARMQAALKDKAGYTGKLDGSYGPQSHASLVKFQKDNKLVANGKLDQLTSKALGLTELDPAELEAEGKKLSSSGGGPSGGRRPVKPEPEEEPGFWRKVYNGAKEVIKRK
jgi:hypothetical protein